MSLLEPVELLTHLLLQSSCFGLWLLLFGLRVLRVRIVGRNFRVWVFNGGFSIRLLLEDVLCLQLFALLRHALQLLEVLVVRRLDRLDEYIRLRCFDERVYVLHSRFCLCLILHGSLVEEVFDVFDLAATLYLLYLAEQLSFKRNGGVLLIA